MIQYPTTHKDKLVATINNKKVPVSENEASPWQATGYRLWLYHQIPTFSKANAL